VDSNIEKDVNYTTVYADGIKFFVEKGICRLVFYQNDLGISEESPKLRKDTKLLNFEVRMPIATVDRFCNHAPEIIDVYMKPLQYPMSDELEQKIIEHLNENPYDTDDSYNDESLNTFRKMLNTKNDKENET